MLGTPRTATIYSWRKRDLIIWDFNKNLVTKVRKFSQGWMAVNPHNLLLMMWLWRILMLCNHSSMLVVIHTWVHWFCKYLFITEINNRHSWYQEKQDMVSVIRRQWVLRTHTTFTTCGCMHWWDSLINVSLPDDVNLLIAEIISFVHSCILAPGRFLAH